MKPMKRHFYVKHINVISLHTVLVLKLTKIHLGNHSTSISHFHYKEGDIYMSDETLITTLKTLCEFNKVQITQTFSSKSKQVAKVRCLENTNTFEITNLTYNTVTLIDNLEEAAEIIRLLMNERLAITSF